MIEQVAKFTDRSHLVVRLTNLFSSAGNIFQDPSFNFGEAALAPLEGSPANRFQAAAYVWRELPVPVICAIEGVHCRCVMPCAATCAGIE